jgi:hypothetical protein
MREIAVLKLVQTLDQLEEGARIACAEPDGSQSSGSPMASGSYDFTFREARIAAAPRSLPSDGRRRAARPK